MPANKPPQPSPEQIAELHAFPDDALTTAQEAAAFLRLINMARLRGIAAMVEFPSSPASARTDPLPHGQSARIPNG